MLYHWLRYTATVARVSFLRPRVNDDADAFMTESLLRQGFVAYLVSNGCNADTAEGYASFFNGSHIGTMGYGLVASKSFDNDQISNNPNAHIISKTPNPLQISKTPNPLKISTSPNPLKITKTPTTLEDPKTPS